MTRKRKQAESSGSWNRGSRAPAALTVAAFVTLAGIAVAARAQEEQSGRVNVRSANVRETCSLSAAVVASLQEGDSVEILGSLGEWHRVRLADGREACMHTSVLEVEPAAMTETEAGLVETEGAAAPDPASYERGVGDEESLETAQDRQMVTLGEPEESLGRQAGEPGRTEWGGEERTVTGFIDLSYGAAWAASEDEEWQTFIDPNQGGGVTDDRITYHAPRGEAFSVGGGVLFGPGFGVGIRYSQQTHEDPADIDLFSTFAGPPFQVEAHARTAPDLEREEQAIHVSFVYAPLRGEQFLLRVFVGPSYFDVTQDTVDDVLVTEFPFEIVGFVQGEQDDTALGLHVGADLSWYWGRFGVGVSALYGQAEVEFEDRSCLRFGPPDPSLCDESVDVGGAQLIGGVRLRF